MIPLITIIITSLIIGIILQWLYNTSEDELEKQKKERLKREENFKGADPRKVYGKSWEGPVPRPRICPACGSALKPHEFLYASMDTNVAEGQKKPVHIYGCKFCYLGITDDNQGKVQESLDI